MDTGLPYKQLKWLKRGLERNPRIAPLDEDSMDRWEGVGLDIYRRMRVRVHTLEGEEPAWVYVLNGYEGGLPSRRRSPPYCR